MISYSDNLLDYYGYKAKNGIDTKYNSIKSTSINGLRIIHLK